MTRNVAKSSGRTSFLADARLCRRHTIIDAICCVKYSNDATAVLSHRSPPASLLSLIHVGWLHVWCLQSGIHLFVKLAPWTSLVLVIRRMLNHVSSNCLVLQMSHMKVSCRQLRQHEVGNTPACSSCEITEASTLASSRRGRPVQKHRARAQNRRCRCRHIGHVEEQTTEYFSTAIGIHSSIISVISVSSVLWFRLFAGSASCSACILVI